MIFLNLKSNKNLLNTIQICSFIVSPHHLNIFAMVQIGHCTLPLEILQSDLYLFFTL